MHIRFAIGDVPEEYKQSIAEEEEKHGAFLRIPLQVGLTAIHGPHAWRLLAHPTTDDRRSTAPICTLGELSACSQYRHGAGEACSPSSAVPVPDMCTPGRVVQDAYHSLSYKTMALWRLAEEQFEAEFVIKVDDDNYVRLDRLTHAIDQWNDLGAGARAAMHSAARMLFDVPKLSSVTATPVYVLLSAS